MPKCGYHSCWHETRAAGSKLDSNLASITIQNAGVFLSMGKLSTGMMIRIDIIDISFTIMIVHSTHRKHPSRFSPQIASYKLQIYTNRKGKYFRFTKIKHPGDPTARDARQPFVVSQIAHSTSEARVSRMNRKRVLFLLGKKKCRLQASGLE